MRGRLVCGVFAAAVLVVSGCTSSNNGGAGGGGGGASGSNAGGSTAQGISSSSIKLGTTLPLTGGAATAGASFKAGLQASVKEINDAGGINGRKIDLQILDDGFDSSRSVANILRLQSQSKVFALDMPVGSAGIPGSYPLVKRTGIPMFGPYLPPDPNLPSVFELATAHDEQGQIMAQWLADKGNVKTIGYIGQDNDYGQAVLAGLKKGAQANGLSIAATGLTQTNSTNVSPAVLKVKKSNPDAVVLGTDNTQTALVLKQASQLGWKVLMVGDSSAANTGTSGAVAAAGSAANGLYGAAVAALPTSSSPAIKKFQDALKASSPSVQPDLYSLIGYGTNQVLFEILKKMGDDLTWSNFQKVAESMKNFDTGLLPPITFGPLPGGHTGSHGVLIAQYDNGTWTAKTDFLSIKQS
jgi:branched-chain amino acid transport system substrate-binding protein